MGVANVFTHKQVGLLNQCIKCWPYNPQNGITEPRYLVDITGSYQVINLGGDVMKLSFVVTHTQTFVCSGLQYETMHLFNAHTSHSLYNFKQNSCQTVQSSVVLLASSPGHTSN